MTLRKYTLQAECRHLGEASKLASMPGRVLIMPMTKMIADVLKEKEKPTVFHSSKL